MKAHTQTFKENLVTLGKEIDAKVTFTIDGVETELDGENISSVNPHYEGSILKSVMKQVDITSDIDIPIGTEINVQFGMRYNGDTYEYVNYGNYIVQESSFQEDIQQYVITCYDKMLYAMKEYEQLLTINLFDKTSEPYKANYYEKSDGTNQYSTEFAIYKLEVEPNKTYTLINGGGSYSPGLSYFNKQDEYINGFYYDNRPTIVFTTPNNASYILFSVVVTNANNRKDIDIFKIIPNDQTQKELIVCPITIKDYINTICSKIGLEFANANDTFANYDKEITSELYSQAYTYRDILDELAQSTASTICINDEDKLEIRYLNDNVNETEEVEGTNLTLTDSESARISGVVVEGETTQNTAILPNGYTQVEYIESSGTQYIDTGFKSNSNTRVVMDFEAGDTSTRFMFGARGSDVWAGQYALLINNTTQLRTDYGANQQYVTRESGTRIVVDKNKNVTTTYKNGTQLGTVSASSQTFNANLNMYLFTINNNGSPHTTMGIFKLYSCQIYDNDTLVRDYIPCYNSSNVIGLYDLVGNQFYTNLGSGSFTKGSNSIIPNPDYPQEVKNITGLQEVKIVGKNLVKDKYVNPTTSQYQSTLLCNIDFKPNTTYTISFNGTNGNQVYANENLFTTSPYINIGSSRITTTLTTKAELSKTNASQYDTTQQMWRIFKNARTEPNANIYDDLQIEYGSSATTYEPYKGKTYEINLGKNLASDTTLKQGLWINATSIQANSSGWYVIEKCLPNTKYTISKKNTTGCIYVNFTSVFPVNGAPTGQNNQGANGIKNLTFTTPKNAKYIFVGLFGGNPTNTQKQECIEELQLEKGSQATSYSPYFEPIELGEINDYKDNIFKGGGNYMPPYQNISKPGIELTSSDYQININGTPTATAGALFSNIFTLPKGTYSLNRGYVSGSIGNSIYISGYNLTTDDDIFEETITTTKSTQNENYTFTLQEDSEIEIGISVPKNRQCSNYKINLQITKGTESNYNFGTYGEKGKWYLHKEIGKYEFDGSSDEAWHLNSSGTYYKYQWSAALPDKYNVINTPLYCTHFNQITVAQGDAKNIIGIANGQYNGYSIQMVCDISTLSAFTTWLANNKPVVYYLLATPTTIEITKDNYPELLSQLKALDKAKTYEGTTNITSSFPIKFSYATEYETINEDYIKNVRASFGEKYGPINSIVLSRSAESDNIYIQDEESIEENDLCEIKIVDNQIMNDNNRDQYLPDLLEYLDGIEYYINDFESIGITYLDLCDKYKVKIGDNKYDCVIFNDDVEIGDGLNEIIYTEMPKETITDYTKADKTDRRINQTYLMVDKQNQRIDAVVSTQDEFEESLSSLTIDVDGIKTKVELNYDFVRETSGNNYISVDDIQQDGIVNLEITGTAISDDYLRLHITNNDPEYVDLPITTILKSGDVKDILSIEAIYNEETELYELHVFIDKKLDYIENQIVTRSSSNNFLLNQDSTKLTTESSEDLMLNDYSTGKEDLGILSFALQEGSHTISLDGFNSLDYYLKYAVLNNITSEFALKKHIISEINQTPESITISADKVSLEGKTIDLTSDEIKIESNNFKVDSNGNMTCNNANINGIVNSNEGNIGGWIINSQGLTNSVVHINSDGSSTIYTVADLVIMRNFLMGLTGFELSTSMQQHYDINGDGVVTAQDYIMLQNLIGISMND